MKPGKQEIEKLVMEYLPYVKVVVKEIRNRFGSELEAEELEAYGRMGLVDAAMKYDPGYGCSFRTYAYYRVKGAIIDGIRKDRTLRKGKGIIYLDGVNAYMEAGIIREATGDNNSLMELGEKIGGIATIYLLTEGGGDTEGKILGIERREEIEEAITRLEEREREVIRMFYFEEYTYEEIARVMGVSVSGVCRIHKKAIEHLKHILTDKEI